MTYTHQHTKASPRQWIAGYIVGYAYTGNATAGTLEPIWSDNDGLVDYEKAMSAVKVVALALDKMTK